MERHGERELGVVVEVEVEIHGKSTLGDVGHSGRILLVSGDARQLWSILTTSGPISNNIARCRPLLPRFPPPFLGDIGHFRADFGHVRAILTNSRASSSKFCDSGQIWGALGQSHPEHDQKFCLPRS